MTTQHLFEDKTSLIKNRLVLPDIEDDEEKESFKAILIDFFKKHPNYESKIDWNKAKTLTRADFESVLSLEDTSKSALKRKEKTEIESDIRNIFKNIKDRKFLIVGENGRWLFVAPLNYKAAIYCDSSENQGAGAKWCIGTTDTSDYWDRYISNDSIFVMAFNKNYKNLSKEELQTDMKYMIQKDGENKYHVWTQQDNDVGSELKVVGENKTVADEMFKKVKAELFKSQYESIQQKIENLKNIKEISQNYFTYTEKKLLKGNLTIPNSVKSIGTGAFLGCKGLTSVTIPNSVTSIGHSAFRNCSGITSVTIPNSVTSIGTSAFDGCFGLTSVTIPNSVMDIGIYAFFHCIGLTSVTIPNSVKIIEESVFSFCSNLKSVTIPDSVTRIEEYAFCGCNSLTSVTIPNSVTDIGIYVFYDCHDLASVIIPNSVTSIGGYAFHNIADDAVITVPKDFDRNILKSADLPKTVKFKLV